MSEDHYFTARPASADERRTIRVTLAGRDVEVETAPGIFSPGHVDLGTQVLLRQVPEPRGRVLDIGCGWGPIALEAALRGASAVTAVDVNERALDLLRRNAARLGVAVDAALPEEVPADAVFDTIWSNPPIRIGKEALHALLTTWLPRLAPGGEGYLVVQKNLGADSLAKWIAAQGWGAFEKVGSSKGFRVLRISA
ncbi:methyltransferase [Demequina sp. SYSU T00192]|uniref:Methyltransferase n=1 Tax=Demequina litoralis TaxID=3051660 RepID=A0ABT8GAK6_9MICO|nr:methyltransferase [Demequina sp. SYSU T00192]MDN4476163.1 methyltransferase [Demequina sp. SYSU T00192]